MPGLLAPASTLNVLCSNSEPYTPLAAASQRAEPAAAAAAAAEGLYGLPLCLPGFGLLLLPAIAALMLGVGLL
jgi:hypothetical protein